MTENRTFEEIFEELARHNDRSVIWNDWLDYAIEVNLLTLAKDKPQDFQKNYHNNEEAYLDMITAWITELSQKLEKYPYYDLLGKFYEELVTSQSKSKNLGQFFTPPSVTNLLSELAFDEDKNYKGKIANDPAGGSGRTLLAAHVKSNGEVFAISNDLDETSCKMCVLNFFSHGVRGSVLHMDTLEQTFYQGWRINRWLHHGVPIPHIEKIHSPSEAYDFIELNRLKPEEIQMNVIGNYDNNPKDDQDKEVTIPSAKPTGQTTLI